MSGHTASIKPYLAVFSALMVLTVLTVAAAFQDFGAGNGAIAVTIAVIKAVLVVLIFMHVRGSGKLIAMAAGAGFLWLLIMFGLTMGEVGGRRDHQFPGPLQGPHASSESKPAIPHGY